MNTIKPAFQHLRKDLSPLAKGMIAVSIFLILCVFAVLIYSAIADSQTRSYYRQTIEENKVKLDAICRNAPELCHNK